MKHCCPPFPNPCCKPEETIDFFAQYNVYANPPSDTDLPMTAAFQQGGQIHLNGTDQIVLAPGYLYLINYLFLATPETDGYFQIVPKINNTLRSLYSFFAPAGSQSQNVSAAGSFTTNEALTEEAAVSFHLTYPSTVKNIDISGAISVTPLIKYEMYKKV